MTQAHIDSLLTIVQQEAQRQCVAVTVTIVDNGGHIRAVVRQQDCSYFALESSRAKAITASQLRLPSHVVGNLGQQFPALQASFATNPVISGLPGGFPLLCDGQVVGGIGIAGGNFEQDQSIAAAAAGVSEPRLSPPPQE